MLKKLSVAMLIFILGFCQTVYGYEQEVARFKARLLFVNYDYNGNWKSRAYSHHMQNGGQCLIVCTHGALDYAGNFLICIGRNPTSDYVFALENELIYWHNTGKFDLRKFEHIHLNCCYSGCLPQQFTLPRLRKTVYVISDYTGITYYREWYRNSRVIEVAFGNRY